MSKPTIRQIAQLAQAGTATVERVLNGRGGVRPALAERVISAARTLGSRRLLPQSYRGIAHIEMILVRPETTFFTRVARAVERIASTLDPSVVIHRTFMPETDIAAIAAHIGNPTLRRSGLIVAVPDHPLVARALQDRQAAGLKIIQIVTKITGLAADYVGIDNYAAGRMAGLLLSRMQPLPGSVIAMCHSGLYQAHRDRVRGFSDFCAAHASAAHRFDRVLFGADDGPRSQQLLSEALDGPSRVVGLYNAGGGNAALSAILRHRSDSCHLFFVGHELTERSTNALRQGIMAVVLDQAPEAQARRAIDLMLHRLGILEAQPDLSPIRFVTITAENV